METFEGRFPFLFNKQADYNTNSPSYYDGLAKYNKVLQILAKMIEEYDEKLDNSLENINTVLTNYTTMLDGKLAGFDDSVMLLLREWIDDGTFAAIINSEIFNGKLEKTVFDQYKTINEGDKVSLNNKLIKKVGDGVLATMGDLSQDVKTAMTGGSVAVVGVGAVAIDNLSNDLLPLLGEYSEKNFDTLLTNKAYYDYTDGVINAWDGSTIEGYNTYIKNVVPGEKYAITNYVVTNLFAVGQWRTAADVAGPWVGLGALGQQTDYKVSVPEGMNKLIVTYASVQSVPIIKKMQATSVRLSEVGLAVKNSNKNAIRYTHNLKNLRTRFKYNGYQDLLFDIGPRGSNDIPQIASFFKEDNADDFLPLNFVSTTQFIADQTDWVGPYIVKAKTDIDGDLPLSEHFTGGYHGYGNGAADAVGTATNTGFKVFADKKLLTADCDIYANEIIVEVVNVINATNTKKADGTGRNVLQETVTYKIVGNKIDVDVTIKALEDITIHTYYGIQAYVVGFTHFQFVGDNVMSGVFDTSSGHYGGYKSDSDCNVMTAMTTTDKLSMYVDNMYGIGKLRYLDETTGVCTYMNYGKMYFYLIKNNDFIANTVLNYRGGYKFESLT